MFWDRINPHMTPELERAVAHAYTVFASYRLTAPLIYCDCPVCMTAETAEELSTLSLRDISWQLLSEYTNSAHVYDRTHIEPQFKYFLPRYLEVIAQCDPPSSLGLDTSLTRLDGYRDAWPEKEAEAVNVFFDAFVSASVHQLDLLKWPAGYDLAFDMDEVVGMIVFAGGDLERALRAFDQAADPGAAVHMAAMRAHVSWKGFEAHYIKADYDESPEAARVIGEWLMRDQVSERIIDAQAMLDNPNYDRIIETGISAALDRT